MIGRPPQAAHRDGVGRPGRAARFRPRLRTSPMPACRRTTLVLLLLGVLLLLPQHLALGTTLRRQPVPAALLQRSKQFLAYESDTTLALYRLRDGSVIRRFSAPARVTRFDVTADDKRLVLGSED